MLFSVADAMFYIKSVDLFIAQVKELFIFILPLKCIFTRTALPLLTGQPPMYRPPLGSFFVICVLYIVKVLKVANVPVPNLSKKKKIVKM